jgi:hypothetical protein
MVLTLIAKCHKCIVENYFYLIKLSFRLVASKKIFVCGKLKLK